MKYINKSIKLYLKDLASNLPAPGGGSAAGLTAGLGVSLILMVANFTKGKAGYKKFEPVIRKIIYDLTKYKRELEILVDKDIEAYNNLSKATKLAKSLRRKRLLQKTLKEAARVPYRICEISYSSLKKGLDLLHKGNRNLITDVGCGACFLESAFTSARLNAEINLKYISNRIFVRRMKRALDSKQKEMTMMKNNVLSYMQTVL